MASKPPLTASQINSLAVACFLNNSSVLHGLDGTDRDGVLRVIGSLRKMDAIKIDELTSTIQKAVRERLQDLNDKASAELEAPSSERKL